MVKCFFSPHAGGGSRIVLDPTSVDVALLEQKVVHESLPIERLLVTFSLFLINEEPDKMLVLYPVVGTPVYIKKKSAYFERYCFQKQRWLLFCKNDAVEKCLLEYLLAIREPGSLYNLIFMVSIKEVAEISVKGADCVYFSREAFVSFSKLLMQYTMRQSMKQFYNLREEYYKNFCFCNKENVWLVPADGRHHKKERNAGVCNHVGAVASAELPDVIEKEGFNLYLIPFQDCYTLTSKMSGLERIRFFDKIVEGFDERLNSLLNFD